MRILRKKSIEGDREKNPQSNIPKFGKLLVDDVDNLFF